MKRTVRSLISMSVLGLLPASVGCVEPEERPTPPDLSALVTVYAEPGGEVTRESAQRLVEEAATDLALVSDCLLYTSPSPRD